MIPLEHVFVGGVRAATASRAELTRVIVQHCLKRRAQQGGEPPCLLFDTNGHGISLAATDTAYKDALNAADVVHADGGWIVPVSRFVSGTPIAERSATTDMIHDIAGAGIEHGLRHYLLGGTEEVNAACADRLRQIHPGIIISGRRHGYFSGEQEAAIVAEINAAAPDILWIGLGKPREQLFAVSNKQRLRAVWVITCGGCFNYVTGAYRRAPRWMKENHLEWLFRAVTAPRLLGRYATTSPHALWLTLFRIDRRRVTSD